MQGNLQYSHKSAASSSSSNNTTSVQAQVPEAIIRNPLEVIELYNDLLNIMTSTTKGIKSDSWATGHGINEALEEWLGKSGDSVHIIHPDRSSVESPAASDENNALEGAIQYAKEISGFSSNGEMFNNHIIYKDGETFKKPIVMILNTASVQVSSSISALAIGGNHWQCCVILPKNYKPTYADESLDNENEIIFYIDSLYPNVRMPPLFQQLLTEGIEYEFEAEGQKYNHIIPAAFARAEIVDNVGICPQVGGSDCGWWAAYNAMMIVFTGNTQYLNRFKLKDEELSRDPGYKLRALLPNLTKEAEVGTKDKPATKAFWPEEISQAERIAIQQVIENSLKEQYFKNKQRSQSTLEKGFLNKDSSNPIKYTPIYYNDNITTYSVVQSLEAHYRRNSTIERFMLQEQPCTTKLFVKLKIIEESQALDIESQIDILQNQGKEFIQEDQKDKFIDIYKVFDHKPNVDQAVKKVFIFGASGVGKSTLCQNIAVTMLEKKVFIIKTDEDAKENILSEAETRFQTSIWFPLSLLKTSNLSESNDPVDNLAILIADNCASGNPMPELSVIKTFLNKEWENILFILDGYDEIQQKLNSSSAFEKVLSFIFNDSRTYLILTSRPQAIILENKPLKSDLKLENIGFAQEDIIDFVNKYPFRPKEKSQAKASELIEIINSNANLSALSRIPFNLELICTLFASGRLAIDTTITGLYSEMVNKLLSRRDKKRPNEHKYRELLNGEGCSTQTTHYQLINYNDAIISTLTKIALWGMENNQQRKISIKNILHIIKDQAVTFELDENQLLHEVVNVGIVKVINENKDIENNEIYFNHQTFEEFFCANGLARAFLGEGKDLKQARELLQKHKYDPPYERVWVNLVGFLHNEYINPHNKQKSLYELTLMKFFDDFESEPRELIGLKHNMLILKLLTECQGNTHANTNEQLKVIKNLKNKYIIDHIIDRFNITLKGNHEPIAKIGAISALVSLDVDSAKAAKIFTIIVETLKDKVEGVRLYSALMLVKVHFAQIKDNQALLSNINNELKNASKRVTNSSNQNQYDKQSFEAFKLLIEESLLRINNADLFLTFNNSQFDKVFNNEDFLTFLLNVSKSSITFRDIIIGGTTAVSALAGIANKANNDKFSTLLIWRTKGLIWNYKPTIIGDNVILSYSLGGFALNKTEIKNFYSLGITDRLVQLKAVDVSVNNKGSFILTGLGAVAGGAGLIYGAYRLYSRSSAAFYQDLDQINNPYDNLNHIVNKVNNSKSVALEWSKGRALDLALAISLYSFSCTTQGANPSIWLEPMKDISFVYKNPNLLLSIESIKDDEDQSQNVIVDLNAKPEPRKLTTTSDQTISVLQAIERAFKNAKLPKPAISHYLYGTFLDASGNGRTPHEITYFIYQCTHNLSTVPYISKKAQNLRDAEASGDIDEVEILLEDDEVDIDALDPSTGNTALINAILTNHWEIVKILLEKGANVSFCNNNQENAIQIINTSDETRENKEQHIDNLIEEAFLNETRLQNILIKAINNYKLASTTQAREEVLDKLSITITGKGRGWRDNAELIQKYRMYLNNIIAYQDENTKVIIKAKGMSPMDNLKIRLDIFLELFIGIAVEEIGKVALVKNEIIDKTTLDNTMAKLYSEIKNIAQTLMQAEIFKGIDANNLRVLRAGHIIEHLKRLKITEEFVISTGDKDHCVYVAFHKFNKHEILIRIDNRYINPNTNHSYKEKLDKNPWVIEKGENKKIKSYCLGIFNPEKLEDSRLLKNYIVNIMNSSRPSNIQLVHIYNVTSPEVHFSPKVTEHIAKWPYERLQAANTNNCTLSSYNLGISIRQGKEFLDWLIDKELQLLPHLNEVNSSKVIMPKAINTSNSLKGGPSKSSTQNVVDDVLYIKLIEKLRRELNIKDLEAISTIVIQNLVELADIKTNQKNSYFERYDNNITNFYLKFADDVEIFKFINYYADYPGLIIGKLEARSKNGLIRILIDTELLCKKIVPILGWIEIESDHASQSRVIDHPKWVEKENYYEEKECDRGI